MNKCVCVCVCFLFSLKTTYRISRYLFKSCMCACMCEERTHAQAYIICAIE